jgi:hypothetical protein
VDEVQPVARVPTVEHREPCESRGSRTVLGAPGGEIPPGDSTDSTRLKVSTKSQVIPQQPTFERTSLFVVQGHNRTDIKPSALAALK